MISDPAAQDLKFCLSRVTFPAAGGCFPIRMLSAVLADLRYAFRQLAKTPSFTAIALLTLALGIGANTAVFSVVRSVLLRPLPYPDADRLIVFWEDMTTFSQASVSWPDLQDWKRENQAFSALGGFRQGQYALTGQAEPRMLTGAEVEASFFDAVGLSPSLGRVFTADEDKVGAAPLAVLSHALWQGQFGGASDILGRVLTLNGHPYTVIGVLPPAFTLPENADFYTQLARLSDSASWQHRGDHPGIYALGRLKPGVTFAAGLADLQRVSRRISTDHPSTNTGVVAGGHPLLENLVGSYRRGLWTLLGAVALVLLIACANLAGLLMARSSARQNEIALRSALGASRLQIVRQLFLESLLLAVLGTALGLVLAHAVHAGILALSPTGDSRFQEATLDGPVLLVTCAVGLFAAVLFGLWPAWRSAQTDLRGSLAEGGRGGTGTSARARSVLIVAEIAVTLTLLFGAGLLLRSFSQLRHTELGFTPDHVLSARLSLPEKRYPSPEARFAFYEQVAARVRQLPGVTHVDFATNSPLNTGWQTSYAIPGRPEPLPGQSPFIEMNRVTDGYFQTLSIPLLRGRAFAPEDGGTKSRSIIIDEALARREWPNEDPVGKELLLGGRKDNAVTVIGVVPTLRVYGYSSEPKLAQAYVSLRAPTPRGAVLLVRTDRPVPALAQSVRQAVTEVDPDQPIWDVRMLGDRVGSTLATPRLYTFLLATFAGLALLLAAIGLYGLLAYHVSLRTREFGIRLALGAVGEQLLTLVLRRGLQLVALGTLLGLAGAIAVGRILAALLYQTKPMDLTVAGAVTGLLAAVAILASLLPALRASRVNPVIALRAE